MLRARKILASGAAVGLLALAGAQSAGAETISFATQGCEAWTAPMSADVQVEAIGAAGQGLKGGRGDGLTGSVAVTAGEELDVCVDQGGGEGGVPPYAIRDGGGWSGIVEGATLSQSHVLILAAGGGAEGESTPGGDAGHAAEGEGGGGAGTLTAGGAGAEAGSALQGGHGGAGEVIAGGGGGGYYGGGGGAFGENEGRGGGGGSDFCSGSVFSCTVHSAAGTVHGAGGGADEAHVTLTILPLLGTPTVKKVSPNSGPASGDKVSIISGTNLQFVEAVSFGGVEATRFFTNEAGTEIAVVAPPHAAGKVNITVTTAGGTSAITNKDHYKYLPVITQLARHSGPRHRSL